MTDASETKPRLVLHTRVVTGTGGGPDKTILNSPRFLRDQGYPMVCAYMRPPGDPLFSELERRAATWQATLLAVDDGGPLDWRVVGRFKRICAELNPAIWHGHDYKSNLIGLLVRRSHPMRLITTVHGWVKHTWKTPLYYAIDRYCLPRYDEVICVSRDLYEECLALGVPRDRCWHVPNAIDTEEYSRVESTDESKRRLGLSEQRMLVGAVGRLSEEKGFDLLIRACGQLVARGVNLELWIAGEGDQQPTLEKLVADLSLTDRVRLLGFQSDCRAFYQAMDVFVLSSLREGLPNVLLEAMSMSVPVVSTRVAGVPTLLQEGENGLLVEPGRVDELASAMDRLLADGSLRRRIGEAGRRTIECNHGFRRRMDRIREIYETSFARGGSPP